MKQAILLGLILILAVTEFGWAGTNPRGDTYTSAYAIEKIRFESKGSQIIGNLFLPAGLDKTTKRPAVAIIGPVAFVKEQAPLQYATRLAQQGFITLAFDPRFHGESQGQPRRFESGKAKIEDLKAAIDFLLTRKDTDPDRINILGICQGINWAVEASVIDNRVAKTALVAGHYLVPEIATKYLKGDAAVQKRIKRAQKAKQLYDKTGEVEYIPVVSLEDSNALLTPKPIYDWYIPWENRGIFKSYKGLWENRITRMSEAQIWTHDVGVVMENLIKPTLVIHSDHAASGSEIPKRLFKRIKTEDKKLVWFDKTIQFQFYEDPVTIDNAVVHISEWFIR